MGICHELWAKTVRNPWRGYLARNERLQRPEARARRPSPGLTSAFV
jgi:hypothetical protein